ncbi:M14 family metallopeptidase [Enterocloster asparagiformis]|uniref:M14 family metallopeptidase n=1 Tax=Enterocloster asparagiformis TaxID=333367 RepID=UPI0004667479|nr:M14 family metallopeptidase [Enterocloster asparagiformis]
MIRVFNHEIKEGERAYFTVPAGELAHKAVVQLPVIVVAGKKEGPVLWINGTVHGDELNGSYAAWELSGEIDPEQLSGTLVVTPICNPIAFECRNKISAIDNMDMDTAFPGDPEGMMTQRIAHMIYREIKANAGAVISFHTMATPYRANPYSVRKIIPGVSDSVNEVSEGMQRAFGVVTNCVVDLRGDTNELPGVTSGALDITCMKDGIPAFMGEMGQGGKVETEYVEAAKKGILNVMRYLKMLDGPVEKPGRQVLITKRRFLRSDKGGMIRMNVKSGDEVKAGESLLDLHYYGDEMESYPARSDCYVIGVRENPVVSTGDRVAFVGTEWRTW